MVGDDGGRRRRVVHGSKIVAVFVAVFIVAGDRGFIFSLLGDGGMRVLEARAGTRGSSGAFVGLVVLVRDLVDLGWSG